jgi:hypothetical protein
MARSIFEALGTSDVKLFSDLTINAGDDVWSAPDNLLSDIVSMTSLIPKVFGGFRGFYEQEVTLPNQTERTFFYDTQFGLFDQANALDEHLPIIGQDRVRKDDVFIMNIEDTGLDGPLFKSYDMYQVAP